MQSKQKKKLIILLSIMFVLSIISLFSTAINFGLSHLLLNGFNVVSNNNALLVHFVSVGQGDAIAMNLPNDKIMLIDAGPISANTTLTNYLQDNVLHSKRNNYIDYLVITHPDQDHFGGAMRIIENFTVGTIYLPKQENTTENGYPELEEYIKNKQITTKVIENGINLSQNGVEIKFFGPFGDVISSNERCPVIKLTYKRKSFLFTGDIDETIEKDLIAKFGEQLDCDVLKVAHHGSKTSSCLEFLQVATPDYAVISCGINGYGHPTDEAINNLKSVGATILRTDIQGNVLFALSNNYNLANLNDDYKITPLKIEIRHIILFVDTIIAINVVVIMLKKDDNTKKSRKNA